MQAVSFREGTCSFGNIISPVGLNINAICSGLQPAQRNVSCTPGPVFFLMMMEKGKTDKSSVHEICILTFNLPPHNHGFFREKYGWTSPILCSYLSKCPAIFHWTMMYSSNLGAPRRSKMDSSDWSCCRVFPGESALKKILLVGVPDAMAQRSYVWQLYT